jgi:PKD repeat protein
VYQCSTGYGLPQTGGSNWAQFKNCVAIGCSVSDFGGYSGTLNTITNCADSDNSISSLSGVKTNCITGISSSDFESVDFTSEDFLKINTNSDLYGVGTTSISINTDISGIPRPNQFGLVSIGAHEADNRFDFIADPLETKITKDVNFYFQGEDQPAYSYSWDLDDSIGSSLKNPSTPYDVIGHKTISLTVNDGIGNDATITKNNYVNVLGITIPTKDNTVYPFRMKIGSVNHHLLTEKGNEFYENYGLIVEGDPYVNIGKADEIKWIRVKFIVPSNSKIKYYLWDFGDGATLKTINREVSHKYNMTSTGVIPGIDYADRFSGRWTYVELTAVSYDNRVPNSTTRYPVCIYEIIPLSESEVYFEDGEIIIPEGEVILS